MITEYPPEGGERVGQFSTKRASTDHPHCREERDSKLPEPICDHMALSFVIRESMDSLLLKSTKQDSTS